MDVAVSERGGVSDAEGDPPKLRVAVGDAVSVALGESELGGICANGWLAGSVDCSPCFHMTYASSNCLSPSPNDRRYSSISASENSELCPKLLPELKAMPPGP